MVNVPGRSKGCNTCRRRKKGCDLRRPSCNRCLRDRLQCEGYARTTIFVNHGPGHDNPAPLPLVAARSKQDHGAAQPPATTTTVGTISPLQYTLARGAFGEQFSGLWWANYLPSKDAVPSQATAPLAAGQKPWSIEWADSVTSMSASSNVVRNALHAMSLCFIGNQAANQSMIREGLKHYGSALSELNQALQDPVKTKNRDEVVHACMLLSHFELFNKFSRKKSESKGTTWKAHVEGISRVIQLRGPHKHVSGHAHTAYMVFRWTEIARAFSGRHRSAFGSIEWSSIPWMGHEKTIKETLLDVATPVPGLLEKVDGLVEDSAEALAKILREMSSAREALFAWKKTLDSQLSNYDRNSTAEARSEPEYFMGFGMDVPHCILFFWAVLVDLLQAMNDLGARLPRNLAISISGTHLQDPGVYADYVVRCIRYFLRPEAGAAGSQSAILPIGIVFDYYAFDLQSASKLGSLMEILFDPSKSGPSGPLIGAFLLQIKGERDPKAIKAMTETFRKDEKYSRSKLHIPGNGD